MQSTLSSPLTAGYIPWSLFFDTVATVSLFSPPIAMHYSQAVVNTYKSFIDSHMTSFQLVL